MTDDPVEKLIEILTISANEFKVALPAHDAAIRAEAVATLGNEVDRVRNEYVKLENKVGDLLSRTRENVWKEATASTLGMALAELNRSRARMGAPGGWNAALDYLQNSLDAITPADATAWLARHDAAVLAKVDGTWLAREIALARLEEQQQHGLHDISAHTAGGQFPALIETGARCPTCQRIAELEAQTK